MGVLKAPSGKELQGFKTEYPDAFEEILKKSDDPEVIKAAEEEIAILIRLMKKEGHSPKKIKNMIRSFQLHTPMSHEATEMELFLRKLKT